MDCSWGRIALVTTTATMRHSSGFAGQFFLHLRFQNWTRIMVRSRLFCKEKNYNSQRCHSGRFRITQTAISPSQIGLSQSRGHAAIAIAQRSSSNGSHHKVNRFWNRYVRASCDREHQTPSTREIPAPTPKDVGSDWLEFEDWSFFWVLDVGIWSLNTTHLHIMMRRFVP